VVRSFAQSQNDYACGRGRNLNIRYTLSAAKLKTKRHEYDPRWDSGGYTDTLPLDDTSEIN